MRKFLLTLPILLLSCKTQEQVLKQQNLMDSKSEVVYLDPKEGFVTLRWQCANPPYPNRPCFKFMEIPIHLLDKPEMGDRFDLTKK